MKGDPTAVQPVLIRGDGVAAYCCAHLLKQAGIPAILERPSRPRLPAIVLSEAAIRLLADVFGRSGLFHDLPRIHTRTVLWGPNPPLALPHSAIVISEQVLLDSLRPEVAANDLPDAPRWTVFASRPLPSGCIEHGFGSRVACASRVALKSRAAGCWVESAQEGWLFLIGSGDGTGWVLSVGGADLARSRLVAEQIDQLGASPGGEFPAFPRIISPLSGTAAAGQSWLACGTAAIAFDPLCGDGTAHAVREAILAAAVIRAISAGGRAEEVLAHYDSRLMVGFQRHLANCTAFYRSGGDAPWWRAELHSIERGVAWCAQRLARFSGFRYRLSGYTLESAVFADGFEGLNPTIADATPNGLIPLSESPTALTVTASEENPGTRNPRNPNRSHRRGK